MSNMQGQDLYIKVLSPAGKMHVEHHRAWDKERLFDSLKEQHKRENNAVVLTDKAEYQKYKKL